MKEVNDMSMKEIAQILMENPGALKLMEACLGLNEEHQDIALTFCRRLLRNEKATA